MKINQINRHQITPRQVKTPNKKHVPLQVWFQENERTGDAVHVSFPIQDWGRVGDQPFPGIPSQAELQQSRRRHIVCFN